MTTTNQPSLDDVLDMLLAAYDAPTPAAIADFGARYPAYRADLVAFAAHWAIETHLPEAPPLDDVREAQVLARAQSFLENAIFERSAKPVAQPSAADSLAALAAAAGRSLAEVATAAGLDTQLIQKLDQRRIRAETIPGRIARAIADAVGLSVERVSASWSAAPVVMAGFLPPMPVAPQESFSDAVAASSLSTEAKAALLAGD